jgi:hypothetical protein
LYEKIVIYRDAKKSGLKSKGLSGRVIAQSLTDAHFKANKKMKMVNDENIIKAINRARSKERPPNPKDLNFELAEGGVPPDLNVCDIFIGKNNKRRHLVCYTDKQARLLGTRQRLYMDSTFKIVKKPFVQLYTIHSFIRVGNKKKMAPLLYVLMSRRRRRDYKIIFKFILENVLKTNTKLPNL